MQAYTDKIMTKISCLANLAILFLTAVSGSFLDLPTKSELEQTIFNMVATSPDSESKIGTTFKLYTKKLSTPLSFTTNDISLSIPDYSGFEASKRNIFIVHGFIYQMALPWLERMAEALLNAEDCNVFVVDWTPGDGIDGLNYPKAAANAKVVGDEIAQFIKQLKTVGVDPSNIYIIGHSLGAHIAGFAGSQTSNLGRITGLDPAGPGFRGVATSQRLDPSDASMVDVIHTDASGFLLGDDFDWSDVLGIVLDAISNPANILATIMTSDQSMYYGTDEKMGDLDFFPNNGKKQPGCPAVVASAVWDFMKNPKFASKEFSEFMCCHYRAIDLMIASIKNENCKMEGCSGEECFEMGYHADRNKPDKTHRDIYLTTTGTEPFCKQ